MAIALLLSMRDIPSQSTYCSPTMMRMRHGDGRWAHAVIVSCGSEATAFWFINGRQQSAADFDDWTGAIEWTDRQRRELQRSGWRALL